MAAQPIVILGGFLITGEAYAPMCRWLFTVGAWGWRRLLDRTAALVDRLVCLGSPHTALRATPLRQLVDRRYPGACFADAVAYVSVAGDLALEDGSATARRLAPGSYRAISGSEAVAGDGLVPVGSASLQGSRQLVLPGVAHGGAFGPRWYGTPEVVAQWWCD